VRIGVRTKKLWLPEVGSSELFFHVFPVKIPAKRGMPPANREFHVVAGVVIFPTHPGPRVNLQWVGKTLRAKAAVREKNAQNLWLIFLRFLSVFARVFDLAPDVGFRRTWYRWKACATLSCKVSELRETELGTERYGPANRGRRSVFGLPEGIFLVRIPARPEKVLTIREFHTMHEYVFFPTCPGSRINLLRARKTLRASATTSAEKLWKLQHSLVLSTCFHSRGRRSSRSRNSAILALPESLCYILSKGTGPAHRRTWVREI
jgi:hypothetical protein